MSESKPIQSAIEALSLRRQALFWDEFNSELSGTLSSLAYDQSSPMESKLKNSHWLSRVLWRSLQHRRSIVRMLLRQNNDRLANYAELRHLYAIDDEIGDCDSVQSSVRDRVQRAITQCLFVAGVYPVDCQEVVDRFNRRLVNTVRWCRPRVVSSDPMMCLRSPEFRGLLEVDRDSMEVWFPDRFKVESLIDARNRKQGRAAYDDTASFAHGHQGRLLAHVIGCSDDDGLSKAETSGFLDQGDVPPWDTWVDYVECEQSDHDILVSWVPPEFISLVESGIRVECFEMLSWCDSPRMDDKGEPCVDIPQWLQSFAVEWRDGRVRLI